MLRIFDILKKYREDKKKLDLGSAQAKEQDVQDSKKPQNKNTSDVSISCALNKELGKITGTDINDLYDSAALCAKQIYKADLEYDENIIPTLTLLIEKEVDFITAGNKDLLRYCLVDYSHPDDYIYYHAVNVSIISLEIGVSLCYDRSRLIELGIGAFVHDIGIIKYLDIINKAAVLKSDDFAKVKEHPNVGWDMLKKFAKQISSNIFDVVRQEHERVDGSGYPQGLKENQIAEYARVVGLVDVYEALIHKRPYRSKHTPLETIKIILTNKNAFDAKIIKILIERIGIFPVCTMVKLNTKEIAIVLKENPELPLRPKVNIIIDAYGKELTEPKEVDLSENSMIYIEECVKDY